MTEHDFKIKVLSLSDNVFPLAKRLLVSDEMAHNAIQQSMMKLWENRNQLDKCTDLKAFIFKVVRNVCLDEIKNMKPQQIESIELTSNPRNCKGKMDGEFIVMETK
jgi:RNA polymerase sigma-70 factor (ECF subfamily)